MNPETGEFDADIIEVGSPKTERDHLESLKTIISELEAEHEQRAAPVEMAIERAAAFTIDASDVRRYVEKLKSRGEVYEPFPDHLRTT